MIKFQNNLKIYMEGKQNKMHTHEMMKKTGEGSQKMAAFINEN
jgi:hypothetical protein